MGITPTTWRAPYGDVDDRIRFIAHALGLTTVLWDHVSSLITLAVAAWTAGLCTLRWGIKWARADVTRGVF